MLIGWRATNNHVHCSWVKYSWADDMVQVAKNEMWASEVCFACLTWLYGLFVRTLISLTNAYAGCGRPTLNFIERFDLGRSVPTAKPLHLKTFCILCLCIILCDTSKASENLTFVLKQSLILSSVFVVIIICCLGAMKIKDSVEEITLDLFQTVMCLRE